MEFVNSLIRYPNFEAYPAVIEFRECSKSRKVMQSLTITLYPTPISPPRLYLYPLASVLSPPTTGINRRGMASRRESASFKSLAVGRTSTGENDDEYCTLIDFAGNRLLCLSELSSCLDNST